jgi:hypothetical protein
MAHANAIIARQHGRPQIAKIVLASANLPMR